MHVFVKIDQLLLQRSKKVLTGLFGFRYRTVKKVFSILKVEKLKHTSFVKPGSTYGLSQFALNQLISCCSIVSKIAENNITSVLMNECFALSLHLILERPVSR